MSVTQVQSNFITNGSITTAKIADGNVTTAKIANANVTTDKIADANVTTAKIADANVTTAKIADGAVTVGKLSIGKPSWDTSGNLTATSFVKSGGTSNQYLMADGSTSLPVTIFPSGTTLLFYQTAAPTGWTKITTHNNKALRVVSGTGGGSGGTATFTSVFASRAVPLPEHNHTITDPGHAHTWGRQDSETDAGDRPWPQSNNDCRINTASTGSSVTGITINNAGTAGATMDFAVQYIDVIICSKD